jgi:hypothetical protein
VKVTRRSGTFERLVEGVEIILRNAAFAAFLVVEEYLVGESYLSDHSTEVRIRIAEVLSQNIHYRAIVKAKSCEMLECTQACEAGSRAVLKRANAVHEPVFFAGVFDADYHGRAPSPFLDHVPYERLLSDTPAAHSQSISLG